MSAMGVEMAMKLDTLRTAWRRQRMNRYAVRAAALGLLLLAVGDHGATVSSRGIDPLEILNLQIKPNVLVVLDSSGSMQETTGGTGTGTGDHPRSKMFQAKAVLNQVLAENASKVTFLFGQYTQNVFDPPSNLTGTRLSNQGAGASRFRYTTDNLLSPSMATTELTIARQPPPVGVIDITSENNVIEWFERTQFGGSTSRTYWTCSIALNTGSYTTDAEFATLAAEITTKMQLAAYSPTCVRTVGTGPAVANSYTMVWNTVTRQFTLTRTGGGRTFQMRFASNVNTAAPAMGFFTNAPNVTIPPPNTTTNIDTNSNWTNGPVSTSLTGVASRGFQAFQEIRAAWNTLYFQEGTTNCTVAITPRFYQTGQEMAIALQNAMNSCAGTTNTYRVAFNTGTGRFTFSRFAGSNAWTLQWSNGTNSIRAALNAGTTNQSPGSGTFQTGDSIRLLRRSTADEIAETSQTTYHLIAGKYFNGETVSVMADGTLCNVSAPGVPTNPPTLFLQQVASCGGAAVGSAVVFTFAGGDFGGNTVSCDGFDTKVPLVSCDQTSGQLALITPFLQRELDFNTDGTLKDYVELQNGAFGVDGAARPVPGINSGIKADGSTPIAASLDDIRGIFDNLWNNGQTTPFVDAIKNHVNPKERTIVLFVTDGDDTCANQGSGDADAKAAAFAAERLYTRIVAAEQASSVETFVVGFGSGTTPNRMNWIAWGGSGLGQNLTGQPQVTEDGTRWTETNANLQTLRNQCTTCREAFIAPDAATLRDVLRSIIEQGSSFGEFTAQASVSESIMEYTAEVTTPLAPNGDQFHPDNADTRFGAVVPVLFRSTFTLPGFNGQVRAITNEGGTATERWNAGQVLYDLVANGPGNNGTGMFSCVDGGAGSQLCAFATATTKIQRQIYTTTRNGVFPVTIANYFDPTWMRTNGNRTSLWPPTATVNPVSGTAGTLDVALGIGALTFPELQLEFGACEGLTLPAACTGTAAAQLGQAMKEAREITLAYMAGANMALDNNGDPLRVATGGLAGEILYRARPWILVDTTLADAAVVTPPIELSPENGPYSVEYELYRDGARVSATQVASNGLDVGLGLRNPDRDATNPVSGPDSRTTLKPVMSVLYVPANDMLHAFRAGRSSASTAITCTRSATLDCGGEELWGFVPFDQLGKLRERLRPQTRSAHTYMMAAAVRFADVFVPNTGTTGNYDGTTSTQTVGAASTGPMKGVWRRVLLVGRGIGGKYVTALDITSPGPYTRTTKDATSIIGPVVLWNRGNPDTQNGIVGGTNNNTAGDTAIYAKMGETWSTPTISYVDKLPTTRKPCPAGNTAGAEEACSDQVGGGVSFVAFMGSGYGDAGEGRTFFTLDVLTGDVVADADIGSRTPAPAGGYENALVANAATLSESQFTAKNPPHPADTKATRVYIGDLHGRLWKFLATKPGVAIQFADLGANQPVATPVALLVLPPSTSSTIPQRFIMVTTGQESRADGAVTGDFRLFAFRDDQADTDTASPGTLASCGATDVLPCLFDRTLEPLFRGTVQPATFLGTDSTGAVAGRAIFVGTRFIPPPPESPLSTDVPPYPCRSRFDSIVFVLGAETGLTALNLNASASDDFLILDSSRIVGTTITPDPVTGAPTIGLDQGLSGAAANKPPQKGRRPQAADSAAVSMSVVRPSSTICRQ